MTEIYTRAKPNRIKNDDIAGYAGNTFWLLDGATQLVQPQHGLDASWHVGALDKAFREALRGTPNIDLSLLARSAIAIIASDFFRMSGLDVHSSQELRPFTTLVLCRTTPERGKLDYLVVCDSTLAVIGPDEEQVISDKRIDETNGLDTAFGLLRQGFGFTSEEYKAELRNVYEAVFKRINVSGGFDVIGQDETVIDRAVTGSLDIGKQDHILLMSDGFTRSVDTLGIFDSWQNAVRALTEQGGEAVMEQIRAAETMDAQGKQYPRSSIYDDATLLWLRPNLP